MIWSSDQDMVLQAGWSAGLSTAQIAAMVGGVSASAVRSRRIDLGLPGRDLFTASSYGGALKGKAVMPVREAALPKPQRAPLSEPMSWRRREPGMCAYPVEDDPIAGLLACCAPVAHGSRRPYCPFHLSLTLEAASAVA